jgi:pyruvate-formate lyase-activating enzyme
MISATINHNPDSVLILGGEPLLFPNKLHEYVSGIRDHIKEIFITTALPPTTFETIETLKLLDGINVSIQSIDNTENDRVLNTYSIGHNRIEALKLLVGIIGNKVRVNLNLVRGGIDSREKIEAALSFLRSIGVKLIKLNELQNCPDKYISYERTMGIKLNPPYSHGCNTMIAKDVLLKRSCFLVEDSADINAMSLLKIASKRFLKVQSAGRFAVLYEDGTIKGKWETNEEDNC